jgi:hypothetical protein
MTFTKEQITQALDALPKENRPVMTAIIGQLQAELEKFAQESIQYNAEFVGQHSNEMPADVLDVASAIKQHFGVEE